MTLEKFKSNENGHRIVRILDHLKFNSLKPCEGILGEEISQGQIKTFRCLTCGREGVHEDLRES